jgi:purine nucleoside phosphorylase
VGICSVGSLKPSIGVGSLLVCDDFWCPSDLRRVYADARAHLMPGFSAPVRAAILDVVRAAGFHPLGHGVYANAAGPRFETKAEIRMMADYCDVVGMTAAHEASACAEVGLPYALLAMVDNYAHGVASGANLTVEDFHLAQAANMRTVEACVGALLTHLPSRTGTT